MQSTAITATTPVVVIGFRRLLPLREVLEATEKYSDGDIYVLLDNARDGRDAELRAVREVRSWVTKWSAGKPRVHVRLEPENIGLARAIPTAIEWALGDQGSSVIILEDDCLPSPDFFKFMTEMLTRFANDERVMMVSGDQFLPDNLRSSYQDSYYFSQFVHIWGWGTWRRAWRHYDHSLGQLSSDATVTGAALSEAVTDRSALSFFRRTWDAQRKNPNDSAWASRWLLSCLLQSGLCVCPSKNLIRNIGFGAGSTHTTRASKYHVAPRELIEWPLSHPSFVYAWRTADRWWFRHMVSMSPISRARRLFSRVNPSSVKDKIGILS
ncbi:glycosyltransferase [Microbacterium luteum]|uniref:glycosyltransferase n=1 Tax=Microbacterium luteum TaxID=2782167 RepID=UPI00188757FE